MHRTRLCLLSALVLSLFIARAAEATAGTWTNTGSGNWNSGANWSTNPTFPNAVDDSATFGGAIIAPSTVTLGQNITVASVTFASSLKYTIADVTNTLTMQASAGNVAIASTIAHIQEISSALSLASPLTLSGVGSTIILSGVVSSVGSQAVTLSGVACTLSGTNTFTGNVTLSGNNNQLNISSDANLGNASNNVIATGTTAAFINLTGSVITSRSFTAASGVDLAITGGTATFNGPLVTSDTTGSFALSGGPYILTNANSGLTGQASVGGVALSGSGSLSSSSQVEVDGTFDISQITASSTTITDLNNSGGGGAIALGSKTLVMNQVTDQTFLDSTISDGPGAGSITKSGAATLTFDGTTGTYTGNTNLVAGTLALANAADISTSAALNSTGGTLDISGNTGPSTINTLMGAGAGPINLGAFNLTITQGSNQSFDGAINDGGIGGGSGGSITQAGSSTLTLSGINTYTGGTTLQGPLSVSTDVNLGGAAGGIAFNSGTLITTGAFTTSRGITMTGPGTLNASAGSATYNGAFSGSGALTITTTQPITFNANSTTYTGTTTVNAGTLSVQATFPGAFAVNSGGTLKGTGSLGATTVNNGGKLQPGSSIGTMTVSSATFNANSTFQVEINPTASSLLAVGGSVSINPSAVVAVTTDPGTYTPFTYTILTTAAPPLSGTFNPSVTGLPPGFTGTLFYDPAGAFIQLLLSGVPPPPPTPTPAATPFTTLVAEGIIPPNTNVAAVALYLASLNPPPGSDLAFVISALDSFIGPDFPGLLDALDMLHEAPFAAFTLSIENMTQRVRAAITNRMEFVQKRCLYMSMPLGRLAYVCDFITDDPGTQEEADKAEGAPTYSKEMQQRCILPIGRLSLWGDLIGDFEHQKRLGQNVGYYAPTGAGVLGLDYEAARNVYVGISGAYNLSYLKWGRHRANGTIQSYYASLYVSWAPCYFYLSGSVTGALNYNRATRHIDFSVIHRDASSRHTSKEIAGHLSAGVPLYVGSWSFTPYAAFDYMHLWHNPFREWGANSVDLVIRSKEADYLRSEAGLSINTCIARRKIKTIPSLKIAGVRDQRWGGRRFTGYMAGAGTSTPDFKVVGLHANHTLINPGAALTLLLNQDRTAVSFNYDGQFGHKYWDNTGSLELAHSF